MDFTSVISRNNEEMIFEVLMSSILIENYLLFNTVNCFWFSSRLHSRINYESNKKLINIFHVLL